MVRAFASASAEAENSSVHLTGTARFPLIPVSVTRLTSIVSALDELFRETAALLKSFKI